MAWIHGTLIPPTREDLRHLKIILFNVTPSANLP